MEPVENAGGRDRAPRVSIGMPVYNEGRFLRPALEALVAQSYSDLEIVISDNASTDETEAICREFAARDDRIRYSRNPVGIGAIRNFNRVFEQARGEYFMWASGHDLWSTGYVAAAVQIFDEDPTVVLCSPHKAKIDENGEIVRVMPNRLDTRSMSGDPIGRINVFLWAGPHAYSIYGVIRSSALRRTRLFRPVYAPDIVLLGELSLLGCAAQLFDEYHYARFNRGKSESFEESIRRYHRVFFAEGDRPRRWFPYWRYGRECVRMVTLTKVTLPQRMGLLGSILVALARQRKNLWDELAHLGRGGA